MSSLRLVVPVALLLAGCRAAPAPAVIQKEPDVVSAAPAPPRSDERVGRGAMRALRSSERLQDLLVNQCEPGQTLSCGTPFPDMGTTLMMPCRRTDAGNYVFDRAACATPLVLAFDEAAVAFTSPPGGFVIGPFARTEWVSPRTPWLALDKNGNGCVDNEGELFGPAADPTGRAKNGFETLRALDANGDGRIDSADPAFRELQVWFDADQDRVCSKSEMVPLHTLSVVSLSTRYQVSPRTGSGSYEGEFAAVQLAEAPPHGTRARLVDVYLAPLSSDGP